MSNLNSESASRDVYISSPLPASVDRGYHRIWGWVKKYDPTTTFWAWGGAYEIVEKMKGKLAYWGSRSLPSNDHAPLGAVHRRTMSEGNLTEVLDAFLCANQVEM